MDFYLVLNSLLGLSIKPTDALVDRCTVRNIKICAPVSSPLLYLDDVNASASRDVTLTLTYSKRRDK